MKTKAKIEAEDLTRHAEKLAEQATVRVQAKMAKGAPIGGPGGERAWYVVRSATRQEEQAVTALAEHGFGDDVFMPRETRWFRLGRVRRPMDWPLIPGYLFVRCRTDQLWRIEKLDAVHAVLRRGCADGLRHAVSVPGEFIAELQEKQAAGEFDLTTNAKGVRGEKGEKVRVAEGATMAGWIGEIVSAGRKGRMSVLLTAIGAMTVPGKRVEVAMKDLEAAE